MAPPEDCLFCRIARGELPSANVFESEDFLAFLDINPVAPGHVLLIPKAHHTNLLDAPEASLGDLGALLPRLARAVCKGADAPALNVIANTGREAGQVIDHLHFHLIPRREGDRLLAPWPHQPYREGEQETVRKNIEAALSTG